ncbi:MAG: hypothetical protein ACKPA8_21875 [Dolichospermum sp.]
MTREQGTGFRQLYFLLLMSVFFRSPTYKQSAFWKKCSQSVMHLC